MKIKKLYLSIFILFMYFSFTLHIFSALSQNNTFEYNWSRRWGGNNIDIGYGLVVDSSNNIYFVGYSASFGEGSYDMVMLKYDNSGELLWNCTWGGDEAENGYAVAVDSLDNVYVTGVTNSYGSGGNDMFLVKYNNSGVLLWNRTWGGSYILNVDEGRGVIVDSLNNVYIVGSSNNYGAGEEDVILVKYDDSGGQLWNCTWGGALSDSGFAVAVDSLDNVYLTGETRSYGAGEEDVILVKYNSSGEQLWNCTWGGSLSDTGLGVVVDSSDNIYIAGTTKSFGEGDRDMILVKYDKSGMQLWNRTWGGDKFDDANDIVIDSSNNVYIMGDTKSYISKIEPDMILVKYDGSGVQLSNHTWGGDYVELCFSGAVDSSNNVFLGGSRQGYGINEVDMVLVRFGYEEMKEENGKPTIFGYNILLIISLIGLITAVYFRIQTKKN